jgi:hypothetical protein
MYKYLLPGTLFFVLCLASAQITGSSSKSSPENKNFIGDFEGVKISWMSELNPYTNTYRVSYKFENTNSQCVLVKYRASFTCGRDKGQADAGAKFIPRYRIKEGEKDRLFSLTNPCPKGVRPTDIQLETDITFKQPKKNES